MFVLPSLLMATCLTTFKLLAIKQFVQVYESSYCKQLNYVDKCDMTYCFANSRLFRMVKTVKSKIVNQIVFNDFHSTFSLDKYQTITDLLNNLESNRNIGFILAINYIVQNSSWNHYSSLIHNPWIIKDCSITFWERGGFIAN